mmetsp:Transcript_2849/g.3999  ORF Transcript_2849/g.3999 Transcript_2849/m.3999 type:complete len:455 (-) Transcript_2849:25-1389(-)
MVEVLVLIDTKFQTKVEFLIDRIELNKFTLAQINSPYCKLNVCKKTLQVFFQNGTPCRDNIFCLQPCREETENVNVLRTHSAMKVTGNVTDNYVCVGVDSLGNLQASSYHLLKSSSNCFQFQTSFTKTSSLSATLTTYDHNISFRCQKWQYRRFLNEGYLHLSNIVERSKIDSCRSLLIRSLGVPGSIVAGGVQGEGIGKFAGGLCNRKEIMQLLEGKLGAVIVCFLGSNGFDNTHIGAQIAFRFPETPLNRTNSEKWHTDGLRQGKSHPFSLLVGVCLSDVENENCGNLLLWPGSHLFLHQCKVGPHGALNRGLLSDLLNREPFSDNRPTDPEVSSSSHQIPAEAEADGHHDNEPDLPPLGCPLQLIAKAGDVVLLHPDLAHAGGPNMSPNIREMVYFRLKINCNSSTALFSSWDAVAFEHSLDMWVDLPGLKTALAHEGELDRAASFYRGKS